MVFDQNVKVSLLSISKSFFYLPCMTHLKDKSHTPSVSCWLEVASSTKHMRKITNVSQKPTEQCCSNFAEHYQKHLSEPQVPGMDVRRHRKFWINISSFSFIMETAHLWGDHLQSPANQDHLSKTNILLPTASWTVKKAEHRRIDTSSPTAYLTGAFPLPLPLARILVSNGFLD